MKRIIAICAIAVLVVALLIVAACGTGNNSTELGAMEQQAADESGLELHKIGVATYNIADAQNMMFKDYLDNYIKATFVDVTFLYSDSISSADELMSFLSFCAEQGVDGIMAFNSYDLKTEVDFCAENEIYYIRPAGTFSDAEFESVADNPYFLGQIGPGTNDEYDESAKMTEFLAQKGDGKSYIVLSGGASMGNEMHKLRTLAFIETLQNIYGVKFDQPAEELAVVSQVTSIAAGDLRVVICPGYVEVPQWGDPASGVIKSGDFTTILSVLPVTSLMDALNAVDIECGVIDCFSEDNYFGFKKDKIAYVCGKYQSEIAPGFAALYNAITGNADAFRENGRAFKIKQGFWIATSNQEYDKMYALASGAAVNAYSFNDIVGVIKSMTPDASFEDLVALAEAYSYDDALARRGV